MTERAPRFRRSSGTGANGRLIRLFVLVVAASVPHVSAGAQTAAKIDPADPLTVPRITLPEFRQLHAKDAVLAVDVRTELEFSAGRIPGAVNV